MTTEMIKKTFRPEIKGVDTEDGIIDMLIPMSTASIDRDGESIDPLGWKKSLPAFRKRPVLLSSHDYRDLRKQIGEFKTIKLSEDGLVAKPRYYINEGNEEADWAFKLASKGMAAYSVGFIPVKWEDGDGEKTPKRTYTEQELLEISHVVVPSNRDAIQGLRGKSADPMINQLVEDIVNADDLMEESKFDFKIKEIYQCECIECGHKIETEKHCKDIKCPKCGGEMRRAERPVPGRSEDNTITKPEETDEYIRIPVDRGDHEGHRIRTIDISAKEGIKALYCGECKKVITYLFAKDKGWTMEKAKAWVKEHEGKSIAELQEHKTSQKEIEDEMEFTRLMISENGMSDATKAMAWELVREIMRITGGEMPDDIKALIKTESKEDIDKIIEHILNQTVTNVVKRF